MQYKGSKQKSNKGKLRGVALAILLLLLVAVVAGAAYMLWHQNHSSFTQTKTNNGTATANPNVPGGTNDNSNDNTTANNSKDSSGNTPGPTLDPSVQPAMPTGQFVSNHHASLAQQPGLNSETSACITTPGAMCRIDFTNGSVTKSLPTGKTDENGSYVWTSWTLQSLGITEGTWEITAVAMNGSKTTTAQDATALVVAP